MNKCRVLILSGLLISCFSIYAQTKQSEALKHFKEENYAQAAEIYASIIESANRDIAVNYYYGVCLYYLKRDIDEAIRRLQFSSTKPVSPDVFYYLGKLYQQIYEMELAVTQFEKFLKQNKTVSPKIEDAEKSIKDCTSAIRLINKYFNIQILNKDTVEADNMLKHINLSRDAGELMLSQNFFVSGVERNQIIFKTERGNEVFFPMKESDSTWNLYKIVKLLDSWNEPELLRKPVNSDYDDLYPFLLIDGVTLYFSSNRSGGMGGFDIYQSYYDSETGVFSEPANLGPPFNSPYDDFLLVPDEYSGKAWFVTNRGVDNNQNIVVEIAWNEKVIKNNTENIRQLRHVSSLPLSENAVGQQFIKTDKSISSENKKTKSGIYFIVNDTLFYETMEQFRSEEALTVFKKVFEQEQNMSIFSSHLDKKRLEYSQSYDKNEQNKLYNEILSIERQTYSMEDEIRRNYILARQLELEKIKRLVKEGKYYEKNSEKQTFEKVASTDTKFYNDENIGNFDENEENDDLDEPEHTEDNNDSEDFFVSANNIDIEEIKNSENNKEINEISKITDNKRLEYKIQIGVFRNTPNQKALEKIPAISKSTSDSNGLTKYYSGSWSKYSEAQSMVKIIQEAGFQGAFVVAFCDGEQISLEKAREIE